MHKFKQGLFQGMWLTSAEQKCLIPEMTDPTPEQIEKLATAFERFTRRFKVAEATAAMQNSLNPLDIQALLFIDEHPECNLGDVARHLQVALTTMSSSADRLVRRDMIERQRPEANRRSVALSITNNGHQAVAGYIDGYRASCKAMLQALDPVDQTEFLRLTQQIAKYEV
jgi:DNA-binding MarR family transcriptional regulator